MKSDSMENRSPGGTRSRWLGGILMVLLFVVSVAIRLPHLNKPLRHPHEWLTSTVLRTLQIWEQEGAAKHHFCPVMTYSGTANRNIRNQAGHDDGSGVMYYTSYPPLVYMLPYAIFRTLGVRSDVFPLQVFGLACHFVTCLFIYLIVASLTGARRRRGVNRAAMLAYALYLFAPVALWYHANTYMSDMLVQPFWALGIYLFLRIQQGRAGRFEYAALAVTTCLMIYTEWLGVFFAFSAGLYALLHLRHKGMKTVACIMLASTVVTLAAMIWQYSQINGLKACVEINTQKYLRRSGIAENAEFGLRLWSPQTWKRVWRHYKVSFMPILIAMYTMGWLCFFQRVRPATQGDTGMGKSKVAVLCLTLLPIAMHHALFANFTTIHLFSVLKTGLLFAIAGGLFYMRIERLMEPEPFDRWRFVRVSTLHGFLALMGLLCIVKYAQYARPFDDMDRYKAIGLAIAQEARSEEVVFLETEESLIWPQILVYARRNVEKWAGIDEAKALLAANDAEHGLICTLEPTTDKVIGFRRFDR